MVLRRVLLPALLLLGVLLALGLLVPTDETAAGAGAARARTPPPAIASRIDQPPRLIGRGARAAGSAGSSRSAASRGGPRVRTEPTDVHGRYRYVARETDRYRASVEVAGHVAFPDGTPADFVAVRAQSESPPGLTWSTTHTDARGRFRISGLRPGPVTVETPVATSNRTRVRTSSGAEDLQLVLRLHRTRIRVVDSRGRPHAEADIGYRYVRDGRCPMGRAPVRQADGSRNDWFAPGTHVIVAGHLDGHTVAEQDIVVPRTPWTRTVDLVLTPHGSDTGWLRIHLANELGQTLPKPALVLSSPLAHSRLDRGGNHHPGADGIVANLAPGTFHLSVYPGDTDIPPTGRYCFPVHRQITIRPHAETRLDLRTHTGGRIRVCERGAASVGRDDFEAYVRFERPGAADRHPLWLDPDDDDVSRLLEPGLWTMVVCGEQVREERRAVLVEAGRTRDEEITLRER